MRALRVLGLADDERGVGKTLVLEEASTGEQFTVTCDDRLRAGARGDLSRFGQLEIEMQSQLRPKEIQSRIRAGATVEQVAALAGTSIVRVERFAYPVLLERASIVDRAKKARPAIDGITGSASVAETVAATLAARGHDGDVRWDAYKDEDGWILTLTWSAGRSENRAHWLFHPGPDGGTLSARDDAAAEIVDPALRILRPLRPVRPESAPQLPDPTLPTEAPHRSGEAASRSVHPAGGKLKAPAGRPTPPPRPTQDASRFNRQPQPTSRAGTVPTAHGNAERIVEEIVAEHSPDSPLDAVSSLEAASSLDAASVEAAPVPAVAAGALALPAGALAAGPPPVASSAADRAPVSGAVAAVTAADPASTPVTAARPATPARPTTPARPATPARSNKRGQRPAMPSWEDVLLGTRSTGH